MELNLACLYVSVITLRLLAEDADLAAGLARGLAVLLTLSSGSSGSSPIFSPPGYLHCLIWRGPSKTQSPNTNTNTKLQRAKLSTRLRHDVDVAWLVHPSSRSEMSSLWTVSSSMGGLLLIQRHLFQRSCSWTLTAGKRSLK